MPKEDDSFLSELLHFSGHIVGAAVVFSLIAAIGYGLGTFVGVLKNNGASEYLVFVLTAVEYIVFTIDAILFLTLICTSAIRMIRRLMNG
jgi:ABC-type antimicrobial peptide transport system permease subunit